MAEVFRIVNLVRLESFVKHGVFLITPESAKMALYVSLAHLLQLLISISIRKFLKTMEDAQWATTVSLVTLSQGLALLVLIIQIMGKAVAINVLKDNIVLELLLVVQLDCATRDIFVEKVKSSQILRKVQRAIYIILLVAFKESTVLTVII